MPSLPTDVAGIQARWRFNDLGLSDGAAISAISDIAGGGTARNLSQATGTAQPTYRAGANGINGLGCAEFDGTTDGLNGPSAGLTGLLNGVGAAIVWVIGKNTASGTGTDRHAFFISSNASGSGRAFGRLAVTTRFQAIGGRRLDADTSATVTGGSAIDATTPHIWLYIFDWTNALASIYQDGTLIVGPTAFQTAGNTSATNPADMGLGDNIGLTAGWQGLIAEAGIHHAVGSAGNRQIFDTYAQNTYGITVSDYLPSTTVTVSYGVTIG